MNTNTAQHTTTYAVHRLAGHLLSVLYLVALLGGAVVSATAAEASSTHPAQQRLTPEQIRADVALAEDAYGRIHPGYTRYASADTLRGTWQAIIDRAEAEDGMTLGDFYLSVEAALVTIRCDHTKAELPDVLRDARRAGTDYLPFRWELIEGRGFITAVGEGTELAFGDELLAIDGRALDEVVDTVAAYIPVDGFTDWARRGGISQSREFMGGAVDHFGSLIWGAPPQAALTVRGRDGGLREVQVERVNFPTWAALGQAAGQARNFSDAVHFERIGDSAGYLRVDTFVNYRDPVEPDTLYEPIFQAMRDERRTQLILDLRNNGGGSTDAAHGLMAYLIEEPTLLVQDMRVATLDHDGLLEHLSSWDERALDPNPLGFRKNDDGSYSLRSFLSDELKKLKPKKLAFDGELIVLTSDENSSGSTNLIAFLDGLGRATLVGEKTGGSAEGVTAGVLFFLELPESGVRTRLPFFRYTNNVPSFERGMGVTPDLAAPMTVEAFLTGRDPAMEAAQALLDR
ncbi:MAG: S41 family peptidase [Pseudomonadota bacterium]